MGLTTRIVRRGSQQVREIRTFRVDLLSGPQAGASAVIDKEIFRVGSHEANDLVLHDSAVSRQHLELRLHDAGLEIRDLDSSNGTYSGGVLIGRAVIAGAFELRVGESTLGIVPCDEHRELLATESTQFGQLRGRSPVMRELFYQLEKIAKSKATVLIEGESGVGKELLAESLHEASSRGKTPMAIVDCGAIPEGLFDAQLFGHVRGAFTGATEDRPGLLADADGGTLFLDEVADLPWTAQTKLLGVLERGTFSPVGTTARCHSDFRVLASTREDLVRLVNQKLFREDLYYRLAVVRLRVPPLRERLEDIPLLIEAFVEELRQDYSHVPTGSLSALGGARLAARRWPGNVRQLRNVIEQLLIGSVPPPSSLSNPLSFSASRDLLLREFEMNFAIECLRETQSNVSEAARLAQMDRRNFQRLMKKHGIDARSLAREDRER